MRFSMFFLLAQIGVKPAVCQAFMWKQPALNSSDESKLSKVFHLPFYIFWSNYIDLLADINTRELMWKKDITLYVFLAVILSKLETEFEKGTETKQKWSCFLEKIFTSAFRLSIWNLGENTLKKLSRYSSP